MGHFRPFRPFLTVFNIVFSFFLIRIFSGRLDTSGSMIPPLVTETSPRDAFCEEQQQEQEQQQELGILGGWFVFVFVFVSAFVFVSVLAFV